MADRIKDEFVATLSHELRGPLNAMVGWVHILSEEGIDEATKERGRAAIERGVKAQARLIEDLLDYSRMVRGQLGLDVRVMDLLPVAEAAVEAARSRRAPGRSRSGCRGSLPPRRCSAIRTACSKSCGTSSRTR
jgi:signal transduction histidine kinase